MKDLHTEADVTHPCDPYLGGGAHGGGDVDAVKGDKRLVKISDAPSQGPPSHKGRVYTFATLHQKGILYTPNHIRRLVKRGRFPPPFYMSERVPAWTEATLDAWIAELEGANGTS